MLNVSQKVDTTTLSSLAKVFPDEELKDAAYVKGSALLDESYSFQVAYRSAQLWKGVSVRVQSELAPYITLYEVGLAPSELPNHADHDEHVLRTAPGLYPDPLYPLSEAKVDVMAGQWRSVFVEVNLDDQVKPGTYEIKLSFEEQGQVLGAAAFQLEVIGSKLPAQTLTHTEWFHADCLATYYKVDALSEEHWKLIRSFVRTAVEHGMNMILTPLFTLPLDTAVGGERPTVQLVGVEVTGQDQYGFDFSSLDRWIDMCMEEGVSYIEFSHLFTQWGVKHAPKIVATVNGEEKRIFGWDTDAMGEAYGQFLSQFLPQLKAYIVEKEIADRCYFHVSDEPSLEHLGNYEAASKRLREGLGDDVTFIDALSNIDFYERGIVEHPIPANDHITPFIEHGVDPLWTYYCVSQRQKVSNRFFCMPSARNRVLGIQMYKFNVKGFLHWGYNFWYTQFSTRAIDPYRVTDSGRAFPSGDPFLVYPGEDGPIGSLRLKVMREALQDMRALQLLEELAGREAAMALVEKQVDEPITFSSYPREAAWLLGLREAVNDAIKQSIHSHL
ncbi:DUF4091 domain-containing protein [Paenibacillus aquistagni]|uniref:DUF4091 domain-containing protein n=1 Tax=Paenibacillus aquistagni TaxID=1852522 RepID=UPI00145B376A|nr:DUF4091 domain-containing protein [Paenibacillus aquistagni]NMM54972.1 DUF4091 domain-containing protein [Paenibacillus aquistagni]